MMRSPVAAMRPLMAGALLGALILGIGGRLGMAGIAVANGVRPRFTPGGSATVVLMGVIAGVIGAILAVISQAMATRYFRGQVWARHALLAAGLLLLTLLVMLPSNPSLMAWLLLTPEVVIFGVCLSLVTGRWISVT